MRTAWVVPMALLCLSSIAPPALAQTPRCDLGAPGSRDPGWSPDGRRIVFASNRAGDHDLYVVGVDGGDARRLTRTPTEDHYPFFSPDGSEIVFMGISGDTTVIHVVAADGGEPRSLTGADEVNADPHWSPDGSWIAFSSERDGNAEIYVMRSDGTEARRLTRHEASEQSPRFSPDGSRVLFVSTRGGGADLYEIVLGTGDLRPVVQDPREDRVPSWSPDGSRIAWYTVDRSIGSAATAAERERLWSTAEIVVMSVEDGERVQLTDDDVMDHGPVFSPDGRRIAFTSCRSGSREIYLMNADGSDARRLTFTPDERP